MTHDDPLISPTAIGSPDSSFEHTHSEHHPLRSETTKAETLAVAAEELTKSVNQLHRDVRTRAIGFLVALVLIVIVGAGVAIVGWRSEHFLTCQIQQNVEFRQAATTERAAQRRLFDTVLNPASTDADRHKATQDYYTGLIAADQQRTDVGAC